MKLLIGMPNAKISTLLANVNCMKVIRVSDEGQVLIPEEIRVAHQWEAGQELIAIDMGDGILLKPKKPFPQTTLDQVAGSLKYEGKPKTLEEMEDAIRQGVMEQHDRG